MCLLQICLVCPNIWIGGLNLCCCPVGRNCGLLASGPGCSACGDSTVSYFGVFGRFDLAALMVQRHLEVFFSSVFALRVCWQNGCSTGGTAGLLAVRPMLC